MGLSSASELSLTDIHASDQHQTLSTQNKKRIIWLIIEIHSICTGLHSSHRMRIAYIYLRHVPMYLLRHRSYGKKSRIINNDQVSTKQNFTEFWKLQYHLAIQTECIHWNICPQT